MAALLIRIVLMVSVVSSCLPSSAKLACRDQGDCFTNALCIKNVCVTEASGPLPAPALQVSLQNQQVVLSWNAIAGATAYNIFRQDPGTSAAYQIASTSAVAYRDALGWNSCDTYIYTVYASQETEIGLASDALSVSPHDALACWTVARRVPHWRAVASDAAHAFAWSDDGIARTTDSGTTWSAPVAVDGLPAAPVALLDRAGVLTAVGRTAIASSTDGVSFTAISASGTFVAAAADATRIALFDVDGDAWWGSTASTLTHAAAPPHASLNAAAAGAGIFIAVGDHGGLYTSADVQSWEAQLVPTTHALTAIGFAAGFAAIDDAGQVITPTDATYATWQVARVAGFAGVTAIGATGDTLLAFAANGMAITSVDWNAAPVRVAPAHRIEAATSGKSTIAVGEADTKIVCNPGCTVISADTSLRAVAADATEVVGVGTNGGVVRSSDRQSWQFSRIDTFATLTALATSAGVWVALTDDGAIYRSTDSVSWALVRGSSTPIARAIAANGSLFVAVGDAGLALTSADGKDWTTQSALISADLVGVAYGAGHWASITADGRSLRSSDALDWSSAYIISPGCVPAGLRFALGNFVAYGAGGFVALSADAQSWASRPLPVADAVTTAASSGTSLVVAAGDSLYGAIGTAPWQPLRITEATSPSPRDMLPDISVLVGDDGFVAAK